MEQAQQEIEQLRRQLAKQKQIAYVSGIFQANITVRTLIESLTEGFFVVDADGIIMLANQRGVDLFGYGQRDELIGHNIHALLPMRQREIHSRHIQKFFDTPRIRLMGQGVDLIGMRKDGSEFAVEISLSYLKTEVGRLGLAFVTDITERKHFERSLQHRNEELDAFAHMVAHDLKTSLATLDGYSQLFSEMVEMHDFGQIDNIAVAFQRNIKRMESIIDEMLGFASIRKQDVSFAPVDLRDVLNSTLERLNYFLRENEAEWTLPEHYASVIGHAPWIEEVVVNYVTNAVKYGGTPPKLTFLCERSGDTVTFSVRDNGDGIAPEDIEALFKPFSRKHDNPNGHGLGLSIVQRIVRKLNGTVGVNSTPGEGSTFFFTLPAA